MKMELTLGGDFITPSYSMFSGQAEAVNHTYNLHLFKTGRIYLVSTEPDCGGNIYVQGGPNSQGFGGASLTFTLANGCDKITLKGPWHINSDALFNDTGIDTRSKHLTFGVIGTGKEHKDSRSIIKNLIYFDTEPTLGVFSRIQNLAETLSEERQETLYYYSENKSGSSCGSVNYGKFK